LRGLKFQVVTAFGRAARWHLLSVSPFLPWRRVVTATPRRHFPGSFSEEASVRVYGISVPWGKSFLSEGAASLIRRLPSASSGHSRLGRSGLPWRAVSEAVHGAVGDGATQQNAVAGVTGSSKSAACSFPGAHARSDRAASDDACMKNFSTAR